MQNDNQNNEQQEIEEFDVNSLADSLLGKEEEVKDEKPTEEVKAEEEKSEDKGDDNTADGDKTDDTADDTADDTDKAEDKSTEEDNRPLTREDIRAAMREEAVAREAEVSQRQSYAGQVREQLKEDLKLDSTYTTVSLEDGTPIESVSQLTQVINPETDEPYTREEAAQLLLEAKEIVQNNITAYEQSVDQLTDLNVNFKEEADEVDRLYGDILRTFPDVAKDLLEAYQKTFKTSEDGNYVTEVPITPLQFYGPALRPFRNATDQALQQQAEAKAAEERAAKEAEVKAEQADRGDLGATAGAAAGKPDLLGDALDKYLSDNT